MKKLSNIPLLIIAVAFIYTLLGIISKQIAGITGYDSVLALTSGFALGIALLSSNKNILIGIGLGAFFYALIQVDTSLTTTLFAHAVLIVITVIVQTLIAVRLFRTWVNPQGELEYERDLINMLKVIPVIALSNTVFTLISQYNLLTEFTSQLLFNIIEIWAGHLLGIVLLLPLLLAGSYKKPFTTSRQGILLLNVSATLVLTPMVCMYLKTFEQERLHHQFNNLTTQTASLFQVSLKEKELLQKSMAQMVVATDVLTRQKFQQFARGIYPSSGFIQVVEWLPKITHDQREAYELEQKKYYGSDFSIRQVYKPGEVGVADKRDVYFPITYLEPEGDNEYATGFDPSASKGAMSIIDRAIHTGGPIARAPIKILRKDGLRNALIVYQAVFQNEDGSKSLNPENGEVIGFVNSVMRIHAFVESIVTSSDVVNFHLHWQDVETGRFYYGASTIEDTPFSESIDIHVSGRDMTLIFTPTDLFIEKNKTLFTLLALVASFSFASVLSLFIFAITTRTEKIKLAVEQQTQALRKANQQLELLSNSDPLTELSNRRSFESFLKNEFARARRYKTLFSLVIFDIDFFKRINDEYGHPCGDEVLKAIAVYLKHTCRASDKAARIGGEEFALILPTFTELEAQEFVERVRREISEIIVKYDGVEVSCTCSFGIVSYNDDIVDVFDMIKRADEALYHAKQTGRNKTQLYSLL